MSVRNQMSDQFLLPILLVIVDRQDMIEISKVRDGNRFADSTCEDVYCKFYLNEHVPAHGRSVPLAICPGF